MLFFKVKLRYDKIYFFAFNFDQNRPIGIDHDEFLDQSMIKV